MDKVFNIFDQWCKENGWTVERRENTKATFPEKVIKRYPLAQNCDYFKFINFFDKCLSADEQTWFLCEREYNKESTETEFGWNDMELMGLLATEDVKKEYKKIESWWNDYLPIVFSTRDGYSHFSISLCKESFGQIVEGYEPMFEDALVVANSLGEFLEKIMSKDIVF